MTYSIQGVTAQIAVFVIGEVVLSDLYENLAVDLFADLAVDEQTDLAVRPDAVWTGSTALVSVTVLGMTADTAPEHPE